MIYKEVVLTNISDKWLDIIYKGETKTMLDNIILSLKDVENITPNPQDWFTWCRYTPVDEIKIIILGQDPYHKKEWAHGLSFSCLKKIPPSLNNIYKCLLNSNLISKKPTTGDLSSWATQGVLMLNTSLSTIIGKAGIHLKLWNPYISKVIDRIAHYHYDNCNQLIFMLWGEFAKKFAKSIDADFHILMNWKHPSPLAQRGPIKEKFINCDHFFRANTYLREEKQEVNWDSINANAIKSDKYNDAKSILNICDKHTIAFTDGSCYPNNSSKDSVGGYAVLFTSGELNDTYIYGNLDTTHNNATNIRAEGYAILRVLEVVYEKRFKYPLTIITDCEFWIKMIEIYMPKWDSAKFKEKNNTDLTTKIWKAYNKLKRITVKFIHVKSHNKSGWRDYEEGTYERYCYDQNDYVDKLCTAARINLDRGCEEINKVIYE